MSGEIISSAVVKVCDQEFEFRNIDPEKTVIGDFIITSDSHYTIKIRFLSGSSIQNEIGYVTNGFDFNDKIIVSKSAIEIKTIKVD
ncbi:MAG: hypothetical protein OEW89_01725 [Gammaproteobacteria bacterium]|nr:hypothetical protein [Gammaproteobacteria bacterium]MDH5592942.1 hypothetical protein [Gammaproteobacteria bacterium]